MQVGTYTFHFSSRADSITIDTPSESIQTSFTVTHPSPSGRLLTVKFRPAWHGTFVRDVADLDWTFRIGVRPRAYYCALTPVDLEPAS
jgi:hypothetical protein